MIHRKFFQWLTAVVLLISVVAEPLGVHAQVAEPPGGTIPALQTEKLQQVEVPERLQIIADATGKSIEELQAMTDAQLVDLIDQNREELQVSSVEREVSTYVEPAIDFEQELQVHEQAVLTHSINSSVYLPAVVGGSGGEPPWKPPQLPVTTEALKERYQASAKIARSLVPAHSNSIPEMLCPSETAGTPVWYRDNSDGGKVYIVGHNDGDKNFSAITDVVIARSFELQTVTFTNGLVLDVDRFYGSDSTRYQITVRAYSGSNKISLMYYTYLVLQDVGSTTLPYVAELKLPESQFTPTARSPMRHACEMLALEAAQRGDYVEAFNSALMLRSAGFKTGSVYGEMWGQIPPSLDFIFTNDAYRNCYIGIDGTRTPSQYWGINGAGAPIYQYESKVCLSVEAYILASTLDPLGLAQYAIGALNLYHNPDILIDWPGPTPGQTTPRQILRYIEETFWIDYGVKKLTGPDNVASGIRTFTFGLAEVLLCYDYHDQTSCEFLKPVASVVTQISFGMPPFQKHEVITEDWGTIDRVYPQGAALVMWRKQSGLQAAAADQVELFLPDKSTIEKVLDECCGMSMEVEGVIPMNAETTYSFNQFLLTWISRLDPGYTAGKQWIPSNGHIWPNATQDWVAAQASMTIQEALLDTGASTICILVQGSEKCIEHKDVINPSVPTISVPAGYAMKIVGAQAFLNWSASGNPLPEDGTTTCPLNPGGTLCGFIVRPYPYTMLLASTLRSIATAQGCRDVTITRRLGSGAEETYPGVADFQVLKEVGYRLTSSNNCSLKFGS